MRAAHLLEPALLLRLNPVATFQGYYQSAAIRRSKVASMLETPLAKDA